MQEIDDVSHELINFIGYEEKFWEVIFKIKRGSELKDFASLKNKIRNWVNVPSLCSILRTKDFLKQKTTTKQQQQ